jgi:hypothetical protein
VVDVDIRYETNDATENDGRDYWALALTLALVVAAGVVAAGVVALLG